jgi:hypothetical protein
LVQEFKAGQGATFIEAKLEQQAKEFVARRQPYLLY